MKFIRLVFIVLPFIITFSCVKRNELFDIRDFANGAIPNMVRTTNDNGIISLWADNDTIIEFIVNLELFLPKNTGRLNRNLEFKEVYIINLEAVFVSEETGVIERAVITNYRIWPSKTSLKMKDLMEVFSSLNSKKDLNLGDNFTFTTGFTFKDGSVLPAFIKDTHGNWIPGYSTSYNGDENNPGIETSLSYTVEYVSAIPTTGTWTGSTQLGAFGIFATNPNVIITALGENNYSISDVAGGFYEAFHFYQTVEFNDDLGSLVIYDNSDAQVNLVTDASKGFPAGTYDPVTQTITFPWYDRGNQFGDVTVLTRN